LKTYGFDAILEKFQSEMKKLSSEGFSGEFSIIGKQTIFVNLCHLACDNLALNGIFGFIECFSGDFFCTMCYATRETMQLHFTEDKFAARTVDEYNSDVANISTAAMQQRVHCRGVKKDCVLNSIPDYHVTKNFSLDVMHTVIEGVIPIEVGCILYYLCTVKHYFTLNDLNKRLVSFWGKVNVDKKNKPPELNRLKPPGSGLSPSMKAVQSLSLLKYLPLIVGDCVPEDDEHWQFLLELSTLVDLFLAPRFTVGMVSMMRLLISDHLATFLELFGPNVRLRPKHHFLVHFPTIILQSGPLLGMSCLRYELKNSFFKRCAHIVCNFTDICHTLAYRHQQFALQSRISNSHVRTFVIVGRHYVVPL
jgi:hypothetical protein